MPEKLFHAGMSFYDVDGCEWFILSADYEKNIFVVETDSCLNNKGKPILETKIFSENGLNLFISHF